jgi:hypothetical protein
MKTQLLRYKGVIAVLILAINVTVSFAQSEKAKQDLVRSFRRFDLQRVERSNSLFGGGKQLRVKAGGRDMQLDIEPHDIRSLNYRSEDSSRPGERYPAIDEVKTFKGKVAGDETSSVRLTIDGMKIEGYFLSEGKKFFIEPAKKYTNLAADGDSVVYSEGDSLIETTLLCDADIPSQIESGKQMVTAQASALTLSMQQIELATDADQQYVANFGSASAANAEILSILNMTEGVYESELNLTLTVVYQHTWSTADPYNATSMNTLLDSFLNYWNANLPTTSIHRDAAHLFTGKTVALSAGLAYVGTMCRNPLYAYGISGFINWAPGKYLVPTHEIGHNLGANHVDATQNCANTIMNATVTGTTPLTFCTYSRNEIGTFVSANGSCLTPVAVGTPTPTPTPSQTPTPTPTPTPAPNPAPSSSTSFDFDGDGRADVAVFRAAEGNWYVSGSRAGFYAFHFGQLGDKPVPGDYDGDGKTDAGVYRNGLWYRLKSASNTFDAVSFGLATDVPAPADFDGDGKTDPAVFRPSTGVWYMLNSSSGSAVAGQFGLNGDVPLPGDFDGDGRADMIVFRPSTGVWYRLSPRTNAFTAAQFGLTGDKPLSGDFDGDGKSDIAVWRPSTGVWYVLKSTDGSFYGAQFGMAGDVPAPADYDGDHKADIAVYRPSTGIWYRMNSSNGVVAIDRFGLAGDTPSAGYYIQ